MKQNSQPFIQVYILCHDRTAFVKEAVTSVLKQNYLNFEVIVSDNSSTNEVFEELNIGDDLNKFRYIRRANISLIEHCNQILSEVTAPYFMMFHDDDVLQKNALQKLIAGFQSDQIVAVGANAFILNHTELTTKLFNPDLRADITLHQPEALTERYLASAVGNVPFSGYLFKSEVAKRHRFSFKEGNKYANASFLLKLSAEGPIVWLADTLVIYRKHPGNFPTNIDIRAILSFCRFMQKNFSASEKIITVFKMKQLGFWSLQRSKAEEKPVSERRRGIFKKAFFVFLLKNPMVVCSSMKRQILKLIL